jgi:hypothetical protein
MKMAAVEELVRQYRLEAEVTLARFKTSYEREADDFLPIALATRWRQALDGDLDIDRLAELVRECEQLMHKAPGYGIAFYGFCADARTKYQALWAAQLGRGT